MELVAPAKINLSLDVIRKRPDGYHDLSMIMQTVALHDRILLDVVDHGIEVQCGSSKLPSGKENTVYKAAEMLISNYKITKGIRIAIEKNIPIAAGLAGGSSDAAAVLKGMNILFDLGIQESDLLALGKKIGADVPYCIQGGTMLAEGIGDILTPLRPLPTIDIVLVKPKISVSTQWVYTNLNLKRIQDRPNHKILLQAIAQENIQSLATNMKNVLETVTIDKYPVIQDIKDELCRLGALGSMMSGSGPTVFGIFSDKKDAEAAFVTMSKKNYCCFHTRTTD